MSGTNPVEDVATKQLELLNILNSCTEIDLSTAIRRLFMFIFPMDGVTTYCQICNIQLTDIMIQVLEYRSGYMDGVFTKLILLQVPTDKFNILNNHEETMCSNYLLNVGDINIPSNASQIMNCTNDITINAYQLQSNNITVIQLTVKVRTNTLN